MDGDSGSGGFPSPTIPEANPPAPTVSSGGTARDFGNMLNYHMPKKVKAKHGDMSHFSPWTLMKPKTQEKIG